MGIDELRAACSKSCLNVEDKEEERLRQFQKILADRDATVERLLLENAELRSQIEKQKSRIGRNSTNSSAPPSSDGPGAAARGVRRTRKRPTGKKIGGQKGHKGTARSLISADEVAFFEHFFPEQCLGCAHPLEPVRCASPRRSQLFETNERGLFVSEQHRHFVACPRCQEENLAPYDEVRMPASPFGPRLSASIAMLTGDFHLSRRETQRLVLEMYGLSISLGAISSIERRVASALEAPEKEIEMLVQSAEVKYADATPWLQAGALRSLWVVTCNIATLFQIFENGQRKTIRPLFGEGAGILVSDRASVFMFWEMSLRQICWAHLLRLFVAFSEKGGAAGRFGNELVVLASLVFDYWKGLRSKAISMTEFRLWMSKVMPAFENTLRRAVASGLPHLAGSCQNLLNHRLALWTFAQVDGVEPTNNNAERSLRRFVMWRKNCFGAFSDRGQVFASRIMSVVATLRQRGVRSLEFLAQCERARQQNRSAPTLFALAA